MKYTSLNLFFLTCALFYSNAFAQQNQWVQIGPFVGSISSLHSGGNGIVFAVSGKSHNATVWRELHRSSDHGVTWSAMHTMNVEGFGVAFGQGSKVFMANNGSFYRSTTGGSTWTFVRAFYYCYSMITTSNGKLFVSVANDEVWMSNDEGSTWQNRSSGLPTGYYSSVLVQSSSGDLFLGCDKGGVYRSTNEGVNWYAVMSGLTSNKVRSLCAHPSGALFAGTLDSGIYRTTNNGTSWVRVYSQSGVMMNNSLVCTPNGQLFASVHTTISSTNNGSSWFEINGGLPYGRLIPIAVTSNGSLLAGANGIFRSTNNGSYWQSSSYSNVSNGIVTTLADHILLHGDPSFRSNDYGASWEDGFLRDGRCVRTSTGWLYSIDLDVGHNSSFYRSSNNGASWDFIYRTTDLISAFGANGSGRLCYQKGNTAYKSTDDGSTWTTLSVPTNATSFAFTTSDHLFVGTNQGVYRTTNFGTSWTQMNNGLSQTSVSALVYNTDSQVFAITSSSLFLSTNAGASWAEISSGLPATFATSIAATNYGYFFAGFYEHGVYRSTNNGASWHAFNQGLTNKYVHGLALITHGYLYASTWGSGVFRTVNTIPVELQALSARVENGMVLLHWKTGTEKNNSGFEIERIKTGFSMEWKKIGFVHGHGTTNEAHDYSFIDEPKEAGHYEYRLRQIDFDGTSAYSHTVAIFFGQTDEFYLEQPFPNPLPASSVNSGSVLRYHIEKSNHISLRVYDALGKERSTLVDGFIEAGTHEVTLQRGMLSRGLYYIRLSNGAEIRSRKIVME